MKKILTIFMAAVVAVGLTACGHTVGDIDLEAGQSAIYIQEDGKISYAVSEKFDKDYYDEDDLEEKIEKEAEDYNKSGKASVNDALSVKDVDVSKDTATMALDFATAYDFLSYIKSYNKISDKEFYIGNIADNTDCKIKGEFLSPDKKSTAKGKDVKKMTDADILIVNEAYKVQVDGTVLYLSDNCSIDDDGIITTAKTDDGMSYIVYNND